MYLSVLFIGLTAFLTAINGLDSPQPASTKCPDVTPMANFDPSKLTGQWFVQMSDAHGVNKKDVKCELRTYTPSYNGSWIDLHVDFLLDTKGSQGSTMDAILVPTADNQASLAVQHSLLNESHIIVDTDYESYAIWVDCVKLGDAAGYMTVVMAAERTPPKDVKTKVQQGLNSTNLNANMTIMEQTKCRKSA